MKEPNYIFVYGNYTIELYNETESAEVERLYDDVYDTTEGGYRPSLKIGIRLRHKNGYVRNCHLQMEELPGYIKIQHL